MTDTPTTDNAEKQKALQAVGGALGWGVLLFPVAATATNLFGWTGFSFFEITSVYWFVAAYFAFRQAVLEGVANALTRYKIWESMMVVNALAEQFAPPAPKAERDPNEVIVPFDPTKKG